MSTCFNCDKKGNHVKSYMTLAAKICDSCAAKINDEKHGKQIMNKYLEWKESINDKK